LNSYYEEYNKYNDKYNLIETIKKYCSPTGGGIQTIFMQLYMSKTLELSNQLLGMLFQGEYKLLDFIINENEFRIPFMDSSGLPIEDVAFGSNAQVSMIGLVINLVLLYQASSHYNIARLDEIGSSCDSYNRSQYIQVLNAVINILHMDQLFVISHDIDLDNTMCDIIKLKGYDGFDNSSLQGNVIFDYDEIIKGGN
jgi:DNA repair exonuclease SbcCD ATPase subunit